MATANADPRLRAFLDLTAWSEGTSTSPLTKNDGYDVIVTGVDGPAIFSEYEDHPFAGGLRPAVTVRLEPLLKSTASGRYQLLLRYWQAYKQMLFLPDFSPESQDLVALRQMKERGADVAVMSGKLEQAITDASNIWASFPGNEYAQAGGKTMAELLARYVELMAAQSG